jgi:hypothetical protein
MHIFKDGAQAALKTLKKSRSDSMGPKVPREIPHASLEPVHLAYNPSFSACFFSQNNIFLSPNQSAVFFSRLISLTERGLWFELS